MISLTHLLNMANKICTFSPVQRTSDQQLIRDDMFLSQKILFGVLAFMTIIVSILCTSNGVLLHKNKRFKNYPLLFFYIFAVLTLLCNPFAFQILFSQINVPSRYRNSLGKLHLSTL